MTFLTLAWKGTYREVSQQSPSESLRSRRVPNLDASKIMQNSCKIRTAPQDPAKPPESESSGAPPGFAGCRPEITDLAPDGI